MPKQRTDDTVTYSVVHSTDGAKPLTVSAARQNPQWKAAMDTEFLMLQRNHTWRLVPMQRGLNVIDSHWVCEIKWKPDGYVDQFKARLVAKGFKQRHGIDYDVTYNPVIKWVMIRVVLSLTVMQVWEIRQLDIVQPPGYVDQQFLQHVCKLEKSLYG
jgi:histone deacetylase 1/2